MKKMMKKRWFIFCDDQLVVKKTGETVYSIPEYDDTPCPLSGDDIMIDVADISGEGTVMAVMVRDKDRMAEIMGEGDETVGLRASFHILKEEDYLQAGKCRELLYWTTETQYCGKCGGVMERDTQISRRCTRCGHTIWPQLATAVIVLIHRGDEVLLVKARNFRGDYYGLVAGFVETGETLEEAVRREVMEETGLTIGNIRYFGSQPWPYPCGLMVGFEADYVSGTIHLQLEELKQAGWFTKDNMPDIPGKMSIARRLIDSWTAGQRDSISHHTEND